MSLSVNCIHEKRENITHAHTEKFAVWKPLAKGVHILKSRKSLQYGDF